MKRLLITLIFFGTQCFAQTIVEQSFTQLSEFSQLWHMPTSIPVLVSGNSASPPIRTIVEETVVGTMEADTFVATESSGVRRVELDETGNVVEEYIFHGNSLSDRILGEPGALDKRESYKYENGKLIERKSYQEEDEPSKTHVYSYEGELLDKVASKTVATNGETYSNQRKFNYDEDKLITVVNYNNNGESVIVDFVYGVSKITESMPSLGENGRKTEVFTDGEGRTSREILHYPEKDGGGVYLDDHFRYVDIGQREVKQRTKRGSFYRFSDDLRSVYEYDDEGALVNYKTFTKGRVLAEEKKCTFRTFDQYGNWLKRECTLMSNGKTTAEVTERSYEYY